MNLPIIVLGAGGHAKVLIDTMRLTGATIIGIVDPDINLHGNKILGVLVIGNDETVLKYPADSILLVNGVGSIGLPKLRQTLYKKFKDWGYNFASVIHPSAVIASDVMLNEGAHVMAGAVIQPGSRIGRNSIVNTQVSVDHDCIIGENVHLSPGVTLSGGVSIGDCVHVGTGATIIQGISIGSNTLVAAGSVVVKNVPDNVTVNGVPARVVSK